MPKVLLIGFDDNVGSTSSVTIGSIHRQSGDPHRSLLRLHPARYDPVLSDGRQRIRDPMKQLLYSGDAR